MRGEQPFPFLPSGHLVGSPPLARGTVLLPQSFLPAWGITPACAGNSSYSGRSRNAFWDHPRLRGEQFVRSKQSSRVMGSPPLARGTGATCSPYCVPCGITPACAGNSLLPFHIAHHSWDHPRLRGEQLFAKQIGLLNLGSPPLARGTVRALCASCASAGITPACAGNSVIVRVRVSRL